MNRIRFFLTFLFTMLLLVVLAQPPGYNFGKQFVIDASQVSGSSPLNDFPVLISMVDPDLRSVGNGGNVENPNGYDIVFTLGDCNTSLHHDLELYNPSTGELVVWVQIPSLDNSFDTEFFMFYGNNTISANPSSASTWTVPGYDGVWHLHNDFLDATGTGNNGVNNGSTNITPAHNSASGQGFNDPNNWIELTNHPSRTGDFSYSGWIRTTNNTEAGQRVICDDATNGAGCHAISIGDPGTGRIRFYIRGMGPVSLDSPGGTIINNTWHYVTATFNSSTNLKSLYVDGALVNSAVVSGTMGSAPGNASIGGEVASGESGNRFNGTLDEVRSSNVVLSSDWIATEYNNQNAPSSFYNVSSQMDANTLCIVLPVELVEYSVHLNEEENVEVVWSTLSETNSDYFVVEKSTDGNNWEEIAKKDGAGNTTSISNYLLIDNHPFHGISYYRLKQVDHNGDFEYFAPKSVNLSRGEEVSIYPNPFNKVIFVEANGLDIRDVSVFNAVGKNVKNRIKGHSVSSSRIKLDVSQLPAGIYFLYVKNRRYVITKM